MNEELVVATKVDIDLSNGEESVASLKKSISNLRDEILNMEKGTKDYTKAVDELQNKQRRLDEVMALTKKSAVALDGSYDSLTHKMALLKKEWRATNDEARRNELGKQIDEINTQLKEFDSSIGNFQRNVGNYESALNGLENTTIEFGDAMREMNERIEPTKAKFESVQKLSSGVASGFAAIQGAAALLGTENEELEQTFIKLQAAMAIAQGVGGLGDLVEGVGKASIAFDGLGEKIKSITKVMGKTGWLAVIGLVITGIALLVSHIKSKTKELKTLNTTLESTKNKNENLASSVGKVVAEYKLLQSQYHTLNSDTERLKWIEKNASAFNALGLSISNLNEAQKAFITNSDKVVEALKLQAEASALTQLYQNAYAESYVTKARRSTISTGFIPTEDEAKNANLTKRDYQGEGLNTKGAIKMRQYFNTLIDSYEAQINSIIEDIITKQSQASSLISSMGLNKTVSGTNTVTDGKTTISGDKMLENTIKYRLKLYEDATNKELRLLDIKRQKEIEDIYKSISDKERQKQEIDNINSKYANSEYEIELSLKEKKIQVLKEWMSQSTDINEQKLIIADEIANAEIELEEFKQERLTEIAKKGAESRSTETKKESDKQREVTQNLFDDLSAQLDDFKDKWDDMSITQRINEIGGAISQSFSSISQITSALADTLENNGESNEENAKKIKNLRIATTTMEMLSGIVAAISSAASLGPVGWALGAIQASSIATIGALNINKIRNTDFNGGASSSNSVPNPNTYLADLPFNYTRNVTGMSETDNLNKEQRVYILESDIQESNRRVQIRESESSF